MRQHPVDPDELELRQSPPRQVRLTSAGVRELSWTAGPVLAALAVNGWLFFERPRPAAIEVGFAALGLLGAGLLARLAALWLRRIGLVREGRPASGVIVEKSPLLPGLRRYRAWYSAGGEQRAADGVGPTDALEIGDAVTVMRLADADGERALIYPLCGCAAEESPVATQSPLKPRI